jgi:WD40 repeat protein
VELLIQRRFVPVSAALAAVTLAASCTGIGTVSVPYAASSSAGAIRVPSTPQTIVISHNDREAFVSYGTTNAVTIVDLASRRVLKTLHMDGQVSDIALFSGGQSLYVTSSSTTPHVEVVDTNSDTARDLLSIPGSGQTLSVSPNGRFAYVTFATGTTTTREMLGTINLARRSIVNTMPIPGFPQDSVITPNGRFLYIMSNPYTTGAPSGQTNFDGQLIVVDTTQHRVTATLDEGQDLACGMAVAPDGDEVVESFCATEGTISHPLPIHVYGTTTNTLLTTIPIQGGAAGLAFSGDGRVFYAATSLDAIDEINAQSNRVTGSIPVPKESELGTSLSSLALSPSGNVVCAGTGILPPSELLVVPLSKTAGR